MLRLLDATKNIEWLSRLKKGTAPNQSQETIPSSCEIWANPAKIVLPFPNSLSITLSLFIKLCQRWDHSLILVLLSCIGPVMLALNWPWTANKQNKELIVYQSIDRRRMLWISLNISAILRAEKTPQACACGLWNMADNMCDNSHYPPLQQLVLLRPCQARTNINQSKPLLERVPPTQLCWMICDCLLWSRIFKGWTNQKKGWGIALLCATWTSHAPVTSPRLPPGLLLGLVLKGWQDTAEQSRNKSAA